MCAQLAASTGPSTVASTAFDRLTQERYAPRRVALGSIWERAVHRVGRMLTVMPLWMWLVIDSATISAALIIAYDFFPPPAELATPHIPLWQACLIFSCTLTAASMVFGLYERETTQSRSRILTRMLLTTTTLPVAAYAVIYIFLYATVSRRATGFALSTFLVTGTAVRLCAWWATHRISRLLLVVGSRNLFNSFANAQKEGHLHEYTLVGYTTSEKASRQDRKNSKYLGHLLDKTSSIDKAGITDIVVDADTANDPSVMDWIVPCLQRGCRVINEAIFYEKATGQILVDQITPAWFLFADLKVHCDHVAAIKRVFDVVTTALVFCVTAPLWPLISLAIKLGDGGPVFYWQDRVGQNGRNFRLYKFRTMRTDAENGKSIWASTNDPRVTRFGRILRKSRLDELPQLYNVLVGQMSVVGPRPERPDIVRDLCGKIPYYAERHLIKPGITGWAQISFRYGNTVEDSKRKLQFDLYYLKHMSFELDMTILFRTLGTFLRGAC